MMAFIQPPKERLPLRTAANAPTGLFLVIRPSAVSATIMV